MSDEPKVLWTSRAGLIRVVAAGSSSAVAEAQAGDLPVWLEIADHRRVLRHLVDERTALEAEAAELRKLVDGLARELAEWVPTLPEEYRPSDYGRVAMLARREAPEPVEAPQGEEGDG